MTTDLILTTASAVTFCLVGLTTVWFVAALSQFGASYFVAKDTSLVAGFSVAIGFVFAGGSVGIITHDNVSEAALKIGMALGLATVWYLFFKRVKSNG